MQTDAQKRYDYALSSDLRELHFLREERLCVIRDEQTCLKRLKRTEIQKHLQSIPGIGFRTAVVLQAELLDLTRFTDKDAEFLVGRLPGLSAAESMRRAVLRESARKIGYQVLFPAMGEIRYQ